MVKIDGVEETRKINAITQKTPTTENFFFRFSPNETEAIIAKIEEETITKEVGIAKERAITSMLPIPAPNKSEK